MDTERAPDVSGKVAPEPLPIDPDERLNWDFGLGRPNELSGATLKHPGVRGGPANGVNSSETPIADDEFVIQDPESLIRGQTRVALVGGGRDRPIVVLDDDSCHE